MGEWKATTAQLYAQWYEEVFSQIKPAEAKVAPKQTERGANENLALANTWGPVGRSVGRWVSLDNKDN